MKLISLVTSEPEASLDCDYALIGLTRELALIALRRIHALKAQKAGDGDLVETYFWDYHAEFFSPWLSENSEEAEAFEELLERLPSGGPDLMTAPSDFSVPISMAARVECCQMVTRENAVAFIAIPKHTDSYVHTAEVPLHLIEAAALA
ncbi:MAG TPA: hypothetical protein VFZ08_04490 [Terriglobia bacterium]|nr:hypothetical protein [Terriglobia bacterium]